MPQATQDFLHQSVLQYARKDILVLAPDMNVGEAFDLVRASLSSGDSTYLYVADRDSRFLGTVSTRMLLLSPAKRTIGEIMQIEAITLPEHATVMQARKMFANHNLQAFPVVSREGLLLGVVDSSLWDGEKLPLAVVEGFSPGIESDSRQFLFDTLRFRFSWLLVTIFGGICCYVIASHFDTTIEAMDELPLFLVLVLGLGENVSIQAMTSVLRHQSQTSSPRELPGLLRKELVAATLLASVCSMLVTYLVHFRGDQVLSKIICVTTGISVVTASIVGFLVPVFFSRMFKTGPAAGPFVLAITDLTTLLVFLCAASLLGSGSS
ncbi:MAG: CBS domain-containing protein [Candidatus Obscuribacterales bacterium]